MTMKYAMTSLFLAWALLTSARADVQVVAEIRLAADPTKAVWVVHRGNAAQISPTQVTKFRVLPGLADSSLVSFEAAEFPRFYLRHQKFTLFLHERQKLSPLFDDDATFKMIHLNGDKVRFEASKFPGKFITQKDDGFLVLSKDPSPAQSTFFLKRD
jgi:hypothetical protein